MMLTLYQYMLGLYSLFVYYIHKKYKQFSWLHALGRLLLDYKCDARLDRLDLLYRISDSCFQVLGLNPGSHTLQGTNTYLIGSGKSKILVDTGEDITSSKYVKFLFNEILPLTNTVYIEAILLTHGHGDHQGGVTAILNEIKKRKQPLPRVYKRFVPNGDFPYRGSSHMCNDIHDNQIFTTEGATLKAILTPGHCDDHCCFYLIEDNALLSGDLILGCGTTVFDNLSQYMNSLYKVRDEYILKKGIKPIDSIYPGHGPVIHSHALTTINDYITNRNNREDVLLKYMQQHKSNGWCCSWTLTDKVYGKLPFFIKVSAQYNLLQHLDKLHNDGMVVRQYPDMWIIK